MGHIFFRILIIFTIFLTSLKCYANQPYVVNQKVKFGKYNSIVNAIFFDKDYKAQITYGKDKIYKLKNVKKFVEKEEALAGINASYFKPDTGTPLGLSIINGRLITGPLLKRSCFGIIGSKYYIDNVDITGKIIIGNKTAKLTNINQPVTSISDIIIYNSNWGNKIPVNYRYKTIGVKNNKVTVISDKSIYLKDIDYAFLISKSTKIPIVIGEKVKYSYKLLPEKWNKMEYAIAAGPCLIKNGYVEIQKEEFSKSFFNQKAPRSAIGIDKYGHLALITVDGRQKNSKGVNLNQFAKILKNLGIINALNLDGGSSTQFVYKNKLQNKPSVKGGAGVTNAIIIKKKIT